MLQLRLKLRSSRMREGENKKSIIPVNSVKTREGPEGELRRKHDEPREGPREKMRKHLASGGKKEKIKDTYFSSTSTPKTQILTLHSFNQFWESLLRYDPLNLSPTSNFNTSFTCRHKSGGI